MLRAMALPSVEPNCAALSLDLLLPSSQAGW
jgi:hypothetical protein